jgi:hypothetical protein
MGTEQKIVAWVFILASTCCWSQERTSYFKPSLLRASATIAPTRFYNQHTTVPFINGFVEYLLEKKISVRGEGFVMVPNGKFLFNLDVYNFPRNCNSWYAGFGYHLGKKNWKMDVHAEPGVLVAELSQEYNYIVNPVSFRWSANPSFLLKIGTSFYFSKFCHFFAELNYSDAWARKTPGSSLSLKQYGLSAGLGFHIITKNENK